STCTIITTSPSRPTILPRALSSIQGKGTRFIMSMNVILAAAIILVVIPTSVDAWTKRKEAHGKTVIAYYASWQWYDRDSEAKPSNLDHTKVTRYNFAFFQPNAKGDIFGTDSWADPNVLYGDQNWNPAPGDPLYCSWNVAGKPPACSARKTETGLIEQAHADGVEVYPSIGGWTLSNLFPALAANPTARVAFANNCVKLIETYDFDGIDIETWNKVTGPNAPLYDMTGSPDLSVHSCVELWKKGGGRPEQINIGLPFYGRSFAGSSITGFGQRHSMAPDLATWGDDEGSPQYFNILEKLSSFTTAWDNQTHTAYAYSYAGFLSYDDERAICDKTEYAVNNKLNGFIIWEISGDLLLDGTTPLLDAMNSKLNDPAVKCESVSTTNSAANNGGNDVKEEGTWYPSINLCTSASPPPFYISTFFLTEAECCAKNYCKPPDSTSSPTPPPISPSISLPSSSPTPPPNSSPTPPNATPSPTPPPISPPILLPSSSPTPPPNSSPTPPNATPSPTPPPISPPILLPSSSPTPPSNSSPTPPDATPSPTPPPISSPTPPTISSSSPPSISSLNPPPILSPTLQGNAITPETTPTLVTQLETSQQTTRPTLEFDLNLTNGDLTGDWDVVMNIYPDFGSESCRNDGNAPRWIPQNMMKSSKFECCSSYFPSSVEICGANNPFYPNFQASSCTNDGKHPKWMGGDYLVETMAQCCNSFFRDSNLKRCNSARS
ncbi:hypothetical protein ACHAXA_010572, partial [Cyclostephanos tholiformis]